MINSHTAKHFIIQELVPESVYEARGEKAWQLIDIRLIENADSLRQQLGVSLTCNTWQWGGHRAQSGLRVHGMSYYKPYSQHTFGRALDLICTIKAQDIRELIRSKEIILPHPACFEDGESITWLHMDVRNLSNGHTYFKVV